MSCTTVNSHTVASLLSPWLTLTEPALAALPVTNLSLDSRCIEAGDLFVAILGHEVDGRRFIDQAIARGAVAVVAQADATFPHGYLTEKAGCPVVYVTDLNDNLSELAGRLYSNQAELIAVTGTNGKTTISQLIAQWLTLLGRRAAVMGTTGNGFLDALQVAANTTGSAIDIQRTLARLSAQGADYVALEVSSHGLIQQRVKALPFAAAVFSNLSRDHLDYHGSMAAYADAKLSLFRDHQCCQKVINGDDPVGQAWLAQLDDAVAVILSPPESSTVHRSVWAEQVTYAERGISMQVAGSWGEGQLEVPLIGAFNASNILLAFATLLSLGFDKRALISVASDLQPVIGRMELFQAAQQPKIVVDYAHTPDALEKALQALRVHCQGQLWVIAGCGGDRDKGKRPMMAAIAEALADRVVLTDDNPRSEDPSAIVADMITGLKSPQSVVIEHDRYQALLYAFRQAQPNDMILLAGKGHEDYQVINGQNIHYSDRESAQQLLGGSL